VRCIQKWCAWRTLRNQSVHEVHPTGCLGAGLADVDEFLFEQFPGQFDHAAL
jgi:hypothetical protein